MDKVPNAYDCNQMLFLDPFGKVHEFNMLNGSVDGEEYLERDRTGGVLAQPEPNVYINTLLSL